MSHIFFTNFSRGHCLLGENNFYLDQRINLVHCSVRHYDRFSMMGPHMTLFVACGSLVTRFACLSSHLLFSRLICLKETDCNFVREDLIFIKIVARWIFLGKEPVIMLRMVIKEYPAIMRLETPNSTANCTPFSKASCSTWLLEAWPMLQANLTSINPMCLSKTPPSLVTQGFPLEAPLNKSTWEFWEVNHSWNFVGETWRC